MPYIEKSARALVDPHIHELLTDLRRHDVRSRLVPTKTMLTHIGRSVARGKPLFHGDQSPAAKVADVINSDFIPEMQEGVLNYVFSRIAAGAFIPHYPCSHNAWPYGAAIASVLKVLERAKLELFDAGTSDTIVAALEGAKLEFYCRVAVPKERKARLSNGDIPEYIEPDVFP